MFLVWYFYLTWILNICNKLRKEPFLSPLGLTLHFQLPKTSAKMKHLWNICSPLSPLNTCFEQSPRHRHLSLEQLYLWSQSLHDSHERWSPPAGAVETPRRLASTCSVSTCSASTQRVNICCKAVGKILLSIGPILTGKWQTLEGCLWWKSQPFVKRHSDQPQVPCTEGCGCREHKLPSQGSFSRVSIS